MSKTIIGWSDRFALIDHYKPQDEQITRTFGVTQDELETARTLRAAGTFASSTKLDVVKFGNVFTSHTGMAGAIPITSQNGGMGTVISTMAGAGTMKVGGAATAHVRPETATKKPKVPQKRGRKGDKIATALRAVPTTQTPVDQFIKQHGVSLPVLRQSKRFIEKLPTEDQKAIGKINVRQDKATRTLMIWREV